MKHFLTIILVFVFTNVFSQIVPSSCELTGDIDTYIEDAKRLKLRQYLSDSSALADSVLIPVSEYYPVLENLMAVRNANTILEVDTINDLTIHTLPAPWMHRIFLQLDTTFSWAGNLFEGNFITGNSSVDSIITNYDLVIEEIYNWPSGNYVTLYSSFLLNDYALANLFTGIEGVIESSPSTLGGDGSDIFYTDSIGFAYITYRFGDGDCLSGCIINRYWNFKVYPDCSVEFMGATGNNLDYLPVQDFYFENQFQIYPNPLHSTCTIKLNSSVEYPTILQVFDLQGKEVFTQEIYSEQESISLEKLTPGYYHASIKNESMILNASFIKL